MEIRNRTRQHVVENHVFSSGPAFASPPRSVHSCYNACMYMINILCLYTYIYIYIFFFESSVPESEKKREGEGKRERKMEKWATKGFLKGSLPGRFLFNPSSTRSFAFVNSSFITVNERLSLFKAWRYTPRWLKCIARIFARIV